jgi:hypothetical protein
VRPSQCSGSGHRLSVVNVYEYTHAVVQRYTDDVLEACLVKPVMISLSLSLSLSFLANCGVY